MNGLLLHHCCAPCSMGVTGRLKENFALKSFWFNPNIQPAGELESRKASFLKHAIANGLEVHYGPDYPEELWTREALKAAGARCEFCYALRLKEAAKKAAGLGLRYFSTTLLASPYQKHELIHELGLKAGREENVEFHYEDFRPYFYEGKSMARKQGFYMQKYCGCNFSLKERETEKQAAKKRV